MDQANRTSLGILMMVGFAILAPVMDACAKLIGDGLAVGQIVTTRFIFQTAILLPIATYYGWLHRPTKHETSLHLARAVLIIIATSFFFTALRYMPIADAISIFFVEPFILTLLGAWLLGEQIGPRRYIACIIGFAGALLIIQPRFIDIGFAAFLPLVTAMCFAFYLILTRQMATRMHPITLQAYTGIAALIIALPLLWGFDGSGFSPLDPSWPDQHELWLLVILGLIATMSHVFISFALSLAPASLIAPIQYLEIVSATILGYYIFNDLPDRMTFLGIFLIVGSGLFVFLRERHMERRPTPAP
ncbi:DMT family transporter [Roseovarius sp. EL26]|uniref:DMT family transporter n=1 Tax=Roseovarius sp. EL26 TaxID=2126672 RepID=UPI000EA3EAC0|nr:DMT family transporter [Roseovarius sp. EL26]